MELDSLPPVALETPGAEEERVLAREVYEHAVILAIKSSDKDAFQRYLGTLRPFYTGFGPAVSESAAKSSIVGLHLLFLLVENQLADFHSEVLNLPHILLLWYLFSLRVLIFSFCEINSWNCCRSSSSATLPSHSARSWTDT